MASPRTDLLQAVIAELRAESARQRLRQVAIAQFLGISQGSVSQKWNGNAPLLLSEFLTWCAAIGVAPSEIVRRAEEALTQPTRLRAVERPAPVEVVEPVVLPHAAYSTDEEPGQDWDSGYDSA